MPDLAPILLVEDSEDDVLFMKRALHRIGFQQPVKVVRDGREALNYLEGKAEFANRRANPLPCLIFLDIKLPYLSGLEVLEWLSSQPSLRLIPVVVLSSSDHQSDVDAAYRFGANSYLVKPSSFERLTEMLAIATQYWLGFNRAPPVSGQIPR